jgi:cytochrome c oxidase subunit 2
MHEAKQLGGARQDPVARPRHVIHRTPAFEEVGVLGSRQRSPRTGRASSRQVLAAAASAVPATLLLAACSADSPSTLDPAGFGARRVAGLWWYLFAVATVVCVIITALVLLALRRRRPGVRVGSGGTRTVVVAGVALPAVVLTVTYGIGLNDLTALENPGGPTATTVEVVGHTWWWEVRYPQQGFVTANEIHIPVGQTVQVRLTTADVNHSFWVPQLMPKTDLIAGRINTTWLRADRAGTFKGLCAEYCGLQHAHMDFLVVAQPQADYQAWLGSQQAPAQATTALQQRGRTVFENASCASCHTVAGTTANGKVGPNLTHLATRRQIGAGTVPNTAGYLAGWISNSQTIKPGNKMPPQPLAPEDLRAVITYLEGLK